MVVQAVLGVDERADDVEGIEGVTGEAVAEADLGCAGTECLSPLSACGSVEDDLDLALKSGAGSQTVQDLLEVVSAESLLVGIGGSTVDQGDVLGSIVAVLLGVRKQLVDSGLHLLLGQSGVVTGQSVVSVLGGQILQVAAGPLTVSTLGEAVGAEDTLLSDEGVTVLTAVGQLGRVLDVVVVSDVQKTEARNGRAGPDLLNDVASVQSQVEGLTELLDSQDTVVVLALLQDRQVGVQLHTEGTGGGRGEVNVLGIEVIGHVLGLEGSVVVVTVQEAHPTSGELLDLTAVDSGDVVLVLVLLQVPTVPVLVLDQLVVRACLKLSELVGTPACGGLERGVVVGGPEGRTVSGSDLASLVLLPVNHGQAGEVVGSPNGEAAVFLQEGVSLVQAENDGVLTLNGVDTDRIPSHVAVLVDHVHSGVVAGAGLEVCAVVLVQELTGNLVGAVIVLVDGLVGDVDPLRALVALSVLVALSAPHSPCVGVDSLTGFDSGLQRSEALATDGLVGTLLVLEEVYLGVLDHQGVVVGVGAEVHEGGIQQLLHGPHEVSGGDGGTVIPLQIVTKGDLPGVATLGLLSLGVAPLCVNSLGDVLQLGSGGVVGGVGTGNDALLVDGAVSVVLLVIGELVVVLEERRTNVAHDLNIIVVGVGEFVPVAGHGRGGSVVLSLLEGRGSHIGLLGLTSSEHAYYHEQGHSKSQHGCELLVHNVFLQL